MIANLEGRVLRHDTTSITLDTGGVGYRVFLTNTDIALVLSLPHDKSVSLFTHLSVRENAMELYGFLEERGLRFFELLLSISGIGPKSALSILNVADVDTLQSAIAENDSSYLTKVSGIGTKSAQKIVLELQGKILPKKAGGERGVRKGDIDAIDALIALGYSQTEARGVIKDIPSDITETKERIKYALRMLGK